MTLGRTRAGLLLVLMLACSLVLSCLGQPALAQSSGQSSGQTSEARPAVPTAKPLADGTSDTAPGRTAAAPAPAASVPQFRLVPADTLSPNVHLLLTVPLADPASLPQVAAGIESRFGVTLAAEWPLQSISVHCFIMSVAANADLDGLIARMQADPAIRTVQKIQTYNVLEHSYSDPLLPAQSALSRINALRAHALSKGRGVSVGVVDSGIDATHPDLKDRIVSQHDFVAGNTGVIEKSESGEAHGTAIAGIIAADADNALGIVGVAPEAGIIELRACWQGSAATGQCNSFSLARALNFAIINKIKVINMSLGGPFDALLEELVRAAISHGLLVVAARGEGTDVAFPASVPGVLSAGASGHEPAIPAPAVDILSTAPGNAFRYVAGSSASAALVSGVAALLLSARPSISSTDLATILRTSLTDHDGSPLLDACKALQTALSEEMSCTQ
ncbi:S8 family peptidase [Roseibium litorale]|uniref:S8 family serine peptidase n=1 Tax=Roseibium litorale TaxID=2803841 RepID=A0ABR9CKD0_9HYPH|nr:S8 family serine peptidase [Roseibium litorale]MBD8891304.1 S8 family serine peptidase [Roseibium litorale]